MRMVRWLVRWPLAIFCFWAAYGFFESVRHTDAPGAMLPLVFGFLTVICGVACLVPDVLPFLARPFTGFIDSVYGTGPGRGRPPLNYNLARSYAARSRADEALEEYRRIMKNYPRELEPYEQSVILHLREYGDAEGAARVFRMGLRRLRSGELRRQLQRTYRSELAELMAP